MPANDLSDDRSDADRRIREHDLLRELAEVNARPRPAIAPETDLAAPADVAPGPDGPHDPLRP